MKKLLNGRILQNDGILKRKKPRKNLTRYLKNCTSSFGYVLKKQTVITVCVCSLLSHKNSLSILFGYYKNFCNPIMEDFQKIIVEMKKVQMDHQQKSGERQENGRIAGTTTNK